jgi:tetratricopeptide (TPR) repeat protein
MPQLLLVLAVILMIWTFFLPDDFLRAAMYGGGGYVLYGYSSRMLLLRYHKRGISLIKVGSYRDAIREFHLSYDFLNQHSWLDTYRVITMLDLSAVPYREMALCNIAYLHVQLNELSVALQHYKDALQQFPESEMAKNGIEHIQSARLG